MSGVLSEVFRQYGSLVGGLIVGAGILGGVLFIVVLYLLSPFSSDDRSLS
jgi:hypothetical protein